MEQTQNKDIVKELYRTGDYIFFEGDLDYHFYIVERGEIQIFTKSKTGDRINIAKIGQGESFGEFALLEKAPRSASAQALTECSLIKVSENGYEQLMSELPVWASAMMKSFAVRLKNMNAKLQKKEQFMAKPEDAKKA